MGKEIEYKFLVASDAWRSGVDRAVAMRQGYFETEPGTTVRVRLRRESDPDPSTGVSREASSTESGEETGELTIKGPSSGPTRPEFEYTIPPSDVEQMLQLFCGERQVEKVRYFGNFCGKQWVIDVFEGEHEGLVLAEIELASADEAFERPDWLGRDVTGEPDYTNAALARR